jgi:site-specific DNA-methyltransferase (adenine-specific)
MSEVKLHLGDCLEVLPTLPDQSVEAIITDLPYGTTACAWDSVIPFAPMWEQVKRVLKPRGVFVTTASQPFTSALVMSNLDWFRYAMVWEKTMPLGFFHAKNKPMNTHEDVLVFSNGIVAHENLSDNRMPYHPQMLPGIPYTRLRKPRTRGQEHGFDRPSHRDYFLDNKGERYPGSVITCSNGNNNSVHPTQKPVSLYEYLILTYTNPGETVLDFCAGSGTTGVAAFNTGRSCILIEKVPQYFEVIQSRIREAQMQPNLFEAA